MRVVVVVLVVVLLLLLSRWCRVEIGGGICIYRRRESPGIFSPITSNK